MSSEASRALWRDITGPKQPDERVNELVDTMVTINLADSPKFSATESPAPERTWMLEDYRARLIGVSALLCAPVSEKNLRDARELIAPLYHDALKDVKAKRLAEALRLPPVAEHQPPTYSESVNRALGRGR